jgi:hypothetical protein
MVLRFHYFVSNGSFWQKGILAKFEFFTMAAKFGRPSFVLLATSNH